MSPNCVDTEQIPSKMVAGDREILGIGENPKSFGESRFTLIPLKGVDISGSFLPDILTTDGESDFRHADHKCTREFTNIRKSTRHRVFAREIGTAVDRDVLMKRPTIRCNIEK